ncbi:multidrug transporter MatE [Clostridia bacterium]|nr:multidrug transporter MatE [Clostridia bacterium]
MTEKKQKDAQSNPLATESIPKLIRMFSIPAIISMLVSSLYNIVDQIFIGRGVGLLGNAATNIAFPVVIITTAVSLLCGIGGATMFNLERGAGSERKAVRAAGNAVTMLIAIGAVITAGVLAFLKPLVIFLGSTDAVMPYALDYLGITVLGTVFCTLTTGASCLIRADHSPNYSMACMLTGCVINAVLNPLFILGFGWGIKGGAWATVIGQVISCVMVILYFLRFSHMHLTRKDFFLRGKYIAKICAYGVGAFINQIAMAIVAVILNNVLKKYGAASEYGADIPLACVGIITKVNMVFFAIVIGVAQGCQPIWGFNAGARKFTRVIDALKISSIICVATGVVFFLLFQFFPREIISIFGDGSVVDPVTHVVYDSELYYKFSVQVFRIYLFMAFVNGLQPLASSLFTSIGKAKLGAFMSLTRQVIFLIPLLCILPMFYGINGVVYATPIADAAAFVFAVVFAAREVRRMRGAVRACDAV